MNKLIKKFNNKEGFTLIEMLIVVAIIAILIAISIPLITKALEKARHNADAANERAAKASLLIEYMNENVTADGTAVYGYNATSGTIVTPAGTAITGNDAKYGQHKTHKDKYIVMTITQDGQITIGWDSTTKMDTNTIKTLCGSLQVGDTH